MPCGWDSYKCISGLFWYFGKFSMGKFGSIRLAINPTWDMGQLTCQPHPTTLINVLILYMYLVYSLMYYMCQFEEDLMLF